MKPQSIGRALGIGLRIAGRIASQRMAGSAQTASKPVAPSAASAAPIRSAGRSAGQASQGLARGIGGFLRPFGRVGSILWLEVSGVFFFLPVVVFGPTLWRVRASYAHGPDHKLFLVTAGIVALFLYLSASSFWRARKK
jgi:hypothetical protein